jgi:exodeoxyribonuclease V alpha subunit
MKLPAEIQKAMPAEAKTLHRLLGFRRNSPQFRHNNKNTMDWDVVVVDEASMVDLALMSKLVDGLKQGGRLILLGDKDQLASVESGAVLVDLIASLPANTVELQKTYRFDSRIKQLAESINKGDSVSAWSLLQNPLADNISLLERDLIPYVGKRYTEYMQVAINARERDLRTLFQLFNNFQILCGVHFGRMGVEGMNRSVELFLARRGYDCHHDNWYAGRPVLVTRNDYGLDLYNGDIGICLPDEKDGGFKVWFERGDGTMRGYSPHRLPRSETVFAMTVHKSQGSEFDEVIVVLPEEDNKILSRELIYTAVTRARTNVKIVAQPDIFKGALSRNIERFSGLAGQLEKNLAASARQ